MSQQALYRFFDRKGQLLYIGITNDPPRRLGEHQGGKDWWEQVAGITVEWHDNREDALAAEARAIHIENPLHNVQRPRSSAARKTVTRQQQIVWHCDYCELPIENGAGYLTFSAKAANEHRRTYAEFKAKQKAASPSSTWYAFDLDEYDSAVSQPAFIHATHGKCDPRPDSDDWWMRIERTRTYIQLLDITLHISQKKWFADTDWQQFIYNRVAGVGWAA